MATVLPADWQDILNRVRGWLETTLADADQREASFRERFIAEEPPDAPPEFPSSDLASKMRALEVATRPADEAALASEEELRQCIERSESLRLRLATRVGRAIG